MVVHDSIEVRCSTNSTRRVLETYVAMRTLAKCVIVLSVVYLTAWTFAYADGFGLQILFRVSQMGMDFSRRGVANLYLVFQFATVLAAGRRIAFLFETKLLGGNGG